MGFTKAQFGRICEIARVGIDSQELRKPTEVAVFLCKLRTSLPNVLIGSIFGVCARTVTNYISKVVKSLMIFLVPRYLNLGNTREMLRSHGTPFSNALFQVNTSRDDGNMLLIWDGIYRYVQKSGQEKLLFTS